MKVGIVAGEESGDQLGAGFIAALRKALSDKGDTLELSGLGGERMKAEGFESLAPMEWLSVMGIVEPLKRLPKLIKLRRDLFRLMCDRKVDVMIGIDSPDFNLGLEKKLKAEGIKTCHYVCPSVWAWRQSRVNKIRESTDHVLTLLPFEQQFLSQHNVSSTFVGHPVADMFAKQGIADGDSKYKTSDGKMVCVMPGSRHSELDRLLDVFLECVVLCAESRPDVRFVIPAANQSIKHRIENMLDAKLGAHKNRADLVLANSHEVMAASDAVLLASGTAALEAGLLAKPMVVAYRLGAITYQIAKRMVKSAHFSLPNLLLDKPVVPELIQHQVTPGNLAKELLMLLDCEDSYNNTVDALQQLMPMLAKNANQRAAEAALSLVDKR